MHSIVLNIGGECVFFNTIHFVQHEHEAQYFEHFCSMHPIKYFHSKFYFCNVVIDVVFTIKILYFSILQFNLTFRFNRFEKKLLFSKVEFHSGNLKS